MFKEVNIRLLACVFYKGHFGLYIEKIVFYI